MKKIDHIEHMLMYDGSPIVYRPLKPGELLIYRPDGSQIPSITDFTLNDDIDENGESISVVDIEQTTKSGVKYTRHAIEEDFSVEFDPKGERIVRVEIKTKEMI